MEFLRDSGHHGLCSIHPVPSELYFEAIKLSRQKRPNIKESGTLIKKLRDFLKKRKRFLHNETCDCEFCQIVYDLLGHAYDLDD